MKLELIIKYGQKCGDQTKTTQKHINVNINIRMSNSRTVITTHWFDADFFLTSLDLEHIETNQILLLSHTDTGMSM